MHFVTGGSFNGKLNWVLQQYNIEEQKNNIKLIRCYHDNNIPTIEGEQQTIIISGLEYYLKILEKSDNGRACFQQELQQWIDWEERSKGNTLILIGTDLSKGVVPIEQNDRRWRDFVGWCYQDIVKLANRVDVIWYGLSYRIKQH